MNEKIKSFSIGMIALSFFATIVLILIAFAFELEIVFLWLVLLFCIVALAITLGDFIILLWKDYRRKK